MNNGSYRNWKRLLLLYFASVGFMASLFLTPILSGLIIAPYDTLQSPYTNITIIMSVGFAYGFSLIPVGLYSTVLKTDIDR